MGPGIKRGSKFDFPGTQVDLAPTWLGLAGLDTPAYMDGRSLVPLLVSKETAEAQGERLPASVLHHLQRTNELTLADPTDPNGKAMISQRQRTLGRTATFHQYYNEGPFGDRKGGHPLDDWSNTWLALYYQSNDGSEYKYAEFDPYGKQTGFARPGMYSLFNLTSDPYELRNIYNATKSMPKGGALIADMQSLLRTYYGCHGQACP